MYSPNFSELPDSRDGRSRCHSTGDTVRSHNTVKEPEKKSNPAGLLLGLLILGIGGAGVWYFLKGKMPDQQTKGDTDLNDYDYGIDEDDDLDYNTEDEQEEQH